jgi:hypothetical protein
MPSELKILYWRRTDVTGMERLILKVSDDEVSAESIVICLEDGGFRLDHRAESVTGLERVGSGIAPRSAIRLASPASTATCQ